MALEWQVGFTGTPGDHDIDAATLIIGNKNAEIEAENERRAALDPPEDPLPLLPLETTAELKASYLSVLAEIVETAHNDYARQAAEQQEQEANVKELWRDASPAQRAAAIAALQA